MREAAEALRGGAVVEGFRPPDVAEAGRIYFGLFYADGLAAINRCLGRGRVDCAFSAFSYSSPCPRPSARCWGAFSAGWGGAHQRRVRAWLSRPVLLVREHAELAEEAAGYRRRSLAALEAGGFGAILCPPSGLPALTHGCVNGSLASSYTYLYNLLGLPAGRRRRHARVRPGEESERGWSWNPVLRRPRSGAGQRRPPVGVQVAALPGRDEVALAAMARWRSTSGRRRITRPGRRFETSGPCRG